MLLHDIKIYIHLHIDYLFQYQNSKSPIIVTDNWAFQFAA